MLGFLWKKNKDLVLSTWTLRLLMGILGIAFPILLWLGSLLIIGTNLEPSVSAYYYTNMRDYFIGTLVAIGMVFVSYSGYQLIDRIVSLLCGIFAVGIAIFPCLPLAPSTDPVGVFQLQQGISQTIHLTCAILFFALLAINSLFLFTRHKHGEEMTPGKKRRNVVYVICGCIIVAVFITFGILFITIGQPETDRLRISFCLEALMIVAFSVSWLVKWGKFPLLRDRP
jgi:hypothetical protein